MSSNSVLRDRKLLHTFALRFTDSLTSTTLTFSAPLLVYAATHNATWSGISFLLQWLPCLTALPIAGPLVDQFGPRRMFIITDSARLVIVLLTMAGLTLYPRAWLLIVALAVSSGILARMSFVAAEHLGRSAGKRQMATHIQAVQVGIDQSVQVIGPMLGGLLLLLGQRVVLGSIATMAAASVLLALRLGTTPRAASTVSIASIAHRLGDGFRIMTTKRQLFFTVASTAASNLLLALITAMTPAFVAQRFHLGSSSVGILWSTGAIASIIPLVGAGLLIKRWGVMRIGRFATLGCCAAALLAGTSTTFVTYAIAVGAFLCMDCVVALFLRAMRAELVPKEQFGSVVGATLLVLLLPYPVAGALLALVPFHLMGALLACSAIGVATITVYSFWQIKRNAGPVVMPELQIAEA
jgi:hypothetical protein